MPRCFCNYIMFIAFIASSTISALLLCHLVLVKQKIDFPKKRSPSASFAHTSTLSLWDVSHLLTDVACSQTSAETACLVGVCSARVGRRALPGRLKCYFVGAASCKEIFLSAV